jgi:hypothetical protein
MKNFEILDGELPKKLYGRPTEKQLSYLRSLYERFNIDKKIIDLYLSVIKDKDTASKTIQTLSDQLRNR